MTKMKKQWRLKRALFLSGTLSLLAGMATTVCWAQTNVVLVMNTNDSGAGSLRAAIVTANGDGAPTAILFDTSVLPCPITIFVGSTTGSQLPALTDPGDTIDGKACGVTLDGSALSGASGAQDGLQVRASNITARGLTIRNFPRHGMRIRAPSGGGTATGVVVSKMVIRDNGEDGLRVSGEAGPDNEVSVTIINNEVFRNGDDGIFVRGSTGSAGDGGNTVKVVIDSNVIRQNQGNVTGGTTSGDGIRILGGSGDSAVSNKVVAIISNNHVRNNVDDGILVAGAGGAGASNHTVFTKIVANRVRNNGEASATSGDGIHVRGGSAGFATTPGSSNAVTFLIANNQSTRSKDRGIMVLGGRGQSHTLSGTVSKNNVNGSGVFGILITGGGGTGNTLDGINILENNVRQSGGNGITTSGGSGGNAVVSKVTIKGNDSSRNEGNGIVVALGSGAVNSVSVTGITDNRADRNGQDGIFVNSGVPGSGATPISGNDANRNEGDGVDIDDGGYVVLENTFKNNTGAGLDADDAGVGVNFDGGGNAGTGSAACNTPGCF